MAAALAAFFRSLNFARVAAFSRLPNIATPAGTEHLPIAAKIVAKFAATCVCRSPPCSPFARCSSYLWYPGHAWLHQDTQIYAALFEHLDHPATLARDLMCAHPHLQWTLYDEIARSLHAVTGLSYHVVLDAQMLLFRWFALIGVFLLARRAGLPRIGALFAALVYALGVFAADRRC